MFNAQRGEKKVLNLSFLLIEVVINLVYVSRKVVFVMSLLFNLHCSYALLTTVMGMFLYIRESNAHRSAKNNIDLISC